MSGGRHGTFSRPSRMVTRGLGSPLPRKEEAGYCGVRDFSRDLTALRLRQAGSIPAVTADDNTNRPMGNGGEMAEFRIEGRKPVRVEGVFHASTYHSRAVTEAVARYRAENPDFAIQTINDQEVLGWCESCGCPLFEGSDYVSLRDLSAMCRHHTKEGT